MKKRRKEILFGLAVVLLCGLLVLFLGTRGKQRQGTGAKPRTVIEYTEEYEIFALYPHFGVAAADEELEAYVAAQCDAFRSDEHAGSGRSELHMEYRLYEPCLGVVSVEMTVFTRVAGVEATTNAAFCYAMPEGERLGLHNLFAADRAEQLLVWCGGEEMAFLLRPDRLLLWRGGKLVKEFAKSEYEDDLLYPPKTQGHSGGTQAFVSVLPATCTVEEEKPMIALTFDDGPNPKYTMQILETLERYGAAATFFEIGSLVEAYPEVSRQIVAQGCEIGNHSYSHRQLTSLSAAEIEEQTRKTQQAIKNAVGYEPTLTRPTYGDINNTVKNCIDMPLILWSIDTLDWKSKDAQAVAEHILSNVKEGDIILMHDVYPSTVEAVELVVGELQQRGFQLVTVSTLLEEALDAGEQQVFRHK